MTAAERSPRAPRRRFRVRLWVAFVALLALVGLGSLALAAGRWTGLEALGVGLAVMAVTFVVVGAIVRRLARPIERLTEATRRFGAGELGYRIPVPEPVVRWVARRRARGQRPRATDEVFALAVAWNEMAARVESQVRGQRELLANVSHELRSPLARVRLALELVPRTPEVEARLADIALDLDELERLVDDTLTTARLDAQGLPTRLEAVDVRALLGSLASRAALDPKTAGREVRVVVSPKVTTVMADPALLRRALWNLVENAGKYGAPPIALSALPVPSGVCLSVEDAGPGVPPDLRDRLFEPFARAAKDRASPGFGLGLAIAQRVAAVHGGSIALADTARGTRIDLVIPVI